MNSRAARGRDKPAASARPARASLRNGRRPAAACGVREAVRPALHIVGQQAKNVRAARDQGPAIVEPLREASGLRLGRDARPARISRSSSIAHSSGHLAPVACPARDVRMSIAWPACDGVARDVMVAAAHGGGPAT
ncbi:hypothetical protein F511_36585 [Dorcoceras hygrometricum]|uniref:Uncharacterized protein n=1 Tax=Dorcoceras hygrometricum TaxID=472368 RepID=A0A2Z7CPM7_9LAMI|nr:hypothetical protein F511_36585 [Dorcoceras hygrometricum]